MIAAPRIANPTTLPPPLPIGAGKDVRIRLVAAARAVSLPCFGGKSLPLWTFGDGAWPPVARMRLGDRLFAEVDNRLPRADEHISIHWHGIRVPNDQDGVPYMTQPPTLPGQSFRYEFTPPDTGTYFFHTHCNTVEQLGRGLLGILIVEGDEIEPYDHELVLVCRDWRVDGAGEFLPFMTAEGAGRGGTFGTIRSVNGETAPSYAVPAAANVRLRILNVDVTRVMEVGVIGADAAIVAIDGVAVEPFALKSWRMGPAMRLDVVMRTPRDGQAAQIVDYFGKDIVTLASLASSGAEVRSARFDPKPLRAGRMPEPDLTKATRIPLSFSATATGQAIAAVADLPDALPAGSLCLAGDTFWAINKTSWASRDHRNKPPPFAQMKLGESYILDLRNLTPHMHPIHLHGHSFKILHSNKRELPAHWADTVLLQPKERLEVAFVADNPGQWMLHCHIIEHQETGMMGYFTVAA